MGDKAGKYRQGQLVWVMVGHRYGPRQKLFTAIIDAVTVKPLRELTQREIERDNPEFRLIEDTLHFLSQIYSRDVSLDDQVSVIHFSEVVESPAWDRARSTADASSSAQLHRNRAGIGLAAR